MRRDFNTFCDLIWGSAGSFPGVVRATVPCRLVGELYQHPLQAPLDQRVAYVTLDEEEPNGPDVVEVAPNQFFVDYDYADVVRIPNGEFGTLYYCLFVEFVDYDGQPTYWRTHVRQGLTGQFSGGGAGGGEFEMVASFEGGGSGGGEFDTPMSFEGGGSGGGEFDTPMSFEGGGSGGGEVDTPVPSNFDGGGTGGGEY